jgi:hypothetical protein
MPSVRSTVPLGLLAALALAAPSAAQAAGDHSGRAVARAAQETDDAPVLPSRVAVAIRRATNSMNSAESHVDENEFTQAITSLRSVRRNMFRADRAATRQLTAPPPVDEEGAPDTEATTGPDSVIAVLALEHDIVTSTAGLFDANSQGVVDGLTHAMFRTLNARDKMLDAVIAQATGDPEGPGAAFADSMADSIDAYPDEVANLTEALQTDTLSAGGRRVLTTALAQVQATAAKVTAAFGGGE